MTDFTADPRKFLESLFSEAVAVADPMRVVAAHLPVRPTGRLVIIGAGKASARMAEAVEAHYGPCDGLVITRYGYERPTAGIEIVQASHPVPDAAGVAATRRLIDLVTGLTPDDVVIALISGGGSALLCAPSESLTLDDKMDVNRALLASGAPIDEMNVVRKHLSLVKGGQLAAACYPAKLLTLLISDVPGDDPSQIASGPTVGEESTALDALDILDRRGIALAPHIRTAIAKASSVVLPNDPRLKCAQTRIVAAPSHSIAAAAKLAVAAGLDVRDLGDALEGEARDLGAQQAQLAFSLQSKLTPSDRPILLLSGGECTVTRCGDGIGGPNAEYTLSAAITLNGQQGIHVLACDTDGVDGAAEVAGAYAGPDTLSIAQRAGSDAAAALIRNDAHGFFAAVKGQIITGPTLTNVNDFRAILILPLNELAIISQVV